MMIRYHSPMNLRHNSRIPVTTCEYLHLPCRDAQYSHYGSVQRTGCTAYFSREERTYKDARQNVQDVQLNVLSILPAAMHDASPAVPVLAWKGCAAQACLLLPPNHHITHTAHVALSQGTPAPLSRACSSRKSVKTSLRQRVCVHAFHMGLSDALVHCICVEAQQ